MAQTYMDFMNETQRTTLHISKILYKALRLKLIGEDKSVTKWINQAIFDEVTPDDDPAEEPVEVADSGGNEEPVEATIGEEPTVDLSEEDVFGAMPGLPGGEIDMEEKD